MDHRITWDEANILAIDSHDRALHAVAYLDATGTIVGSYNGKRSLYYALAVHHPMVGNPPIPVAEMRMNNHSALNIREFLEKFKRDDRKVFSGKDVIPRQITTDYSKAIIFAVLREFNNESLLLFFTRATKVWTSMSLEDKERYHRMAKEKDITEGKSKKDVKTLQGISQKNRAVI